VILEFFQRYKAAYLDHDAALISQVYEFPMTFYTEQGDMVQFEQDALTANSEGLIGLYQNLGVKNVDFEVLSSTELSSVMQLVSILWSFRDGSDNEIYNTITRYVMKQTESGLKIKSVFVVDETTKVSGLKSRSL